MNTIYFLLDICVIYKFIDILTLIEHQCFGNNLLLNLATLPRNHNSDIHLYCLIYYIV